MTLKEAVSKRHTVRKYIDKEIPEDILSLLIERVKENNEKLNLSIELVAGNSDALMGFAKLIIAKGVNYYFVLAGKESADLDEKIGYAGSDLCLYAQTLGLNTWWIGGMVNNKGALKNIESTDVKLNGIITVGYGQTQGSQHKSKKAEDVSSYEGDAPEWFTEGVKATLLAPTAINRQAFTIKGHDNKVSLTYKSGPMSGVDLGICKHHFEVGAEKENFEWE